MRISFAAPISRAWAAAALLIALLGLLGVDEAQAANKPPKVAQSIGAPNRGKLEHPAKLKSTSALKVRPGAHAYGLPTLVRALKQATDKVAKRHRGSVLLVADMSAKSGGRLEGHNSHQSGRDVDIGFYAANSKGRPVTLKRLVAFGPDGKAKDGSRYTFDDARNWALVEALLSDRKANVRYMFVSPALRVRLLAYANKKKASQELVTKAIGALLTPKDCDAHDDHFHVRIACPASMKGTCIEESGIRRRPAADAPNAPNALDAPAAGAEPSADSSPSSPAASAPGG